MTTPVDEVSFPELVARFSAQLDELRSFAKRILVQEMTGPGPHSLTDELHGGKRLRIGNGSATASIVITLPADAPIGTVFLPRQVTAAPLRFVAAAGSTLYHRLGHNGTAGLDAGVALTCEIAGVWLLDGDTALVG